MSASCRFRRFFAALVGAAGLLAVAAGYWHVEAPYPNDAERFGVGLAASADRIVDYDVEALGAGWYLNWGTAMDPPHPNAAPFMQTIRLKDGRARVSDERVRELVQANPGSTWQIGNEPDSIWLDDTEPDDYAAVYHHLYNLIKSEDPHARVANGGLVQATPLRMAYLDRVWQSYQDQFGQEMPVDVWIVHGFILREQRGSWGADIPPGMGDEAYLGMRYQIRDHDDLTIFAQHIERFRQWMADHGQQGKPLIVNEYGILMPTDIRDEDGEDFSDDRVISFMEGTFDVFLGTSDSALGYPADEDRLVQAWAWYSLDDDRYEDGRVTSGGYNGDLFTGPYTKTMTAQGEAYAAYVHHQVGLGEPYTDLAPLAFQTDVVPVSDGDLGSITITVEIVNHGRRSAQDVRVALWGGTPDGGDFLLHSKTVDEIPGRYEGSEQVAFVWAPLPAGRYSLRLEIDPDDAVVEADEANNAVQREVLLPSSWVYLPLTASATE